MIINKESFSIISSNIVSMRKNTLAIRKTLIKNNKNKDLLKKKTEREDAKLLQNKKRRLDEEKREGKSAEKELKKFRMPNWKLNIKNPLRGFGIPGLGILGGVLSFVGFGLLGWMMNKLPEIIKAVKDFMKKGEGFLKGLSEFWEVVKNVFSTLFGAFELLFKKLGFGGTDALGEGEEQKVKDQFKKMADSLKNFILTLPKRLTNLVAGLIRHKITGEEPTTTPVEGYPQFDPDKKYNTGDIVIKNGQLRQFDGMGWAEVKSSKIERDILAFRKARTKFGVSGERVLAKDTFNLAIRDLRGAAGGDSINPLADDLKYEAKDHKGRAHAGGYGFDIPVKDKEQADFVINFFRSRGYETIHGRKEDPSGGHDHHVHVQAPHAKAAEFMARGGVPSTINPVVKTDEVDTKLGPRREVIDKTVELPIPAEVLSTMRAKNQPSQEYFKRSMDIQISIDGDDVREGLFY